MPRAANPRVWALPDLDGDNEDEEPVYLQTPNGGQQISAKAGTIEQYVSMGGNVVQHGTLRLASPLAPGAPLPAAAPAPAARTRKLPLSRACVSWSHRAETLVGLAATKQPPHYRRPSSPTTARVPTTCAPAGWSS